MKTQNKNIMKSRMNHSQLLDEDCNLIVRRFHRFALLNRNELMLKYNLDPHF